MDNYTNSLDCRYIYLFIFFRTASFWGGTAAAIPGELRGYAAAFERYSSGNVSWEELVEPAIRLAEEGLKVTSYLALSLTRAEKLIKMSPTMTEVFINNRTGKVREKLKFLIILEKANEKLINSN